jgi:hypothetical protein
MFERIAMVTYSGMLLILYSYIWLWLLVDSNDDLNDDVIPSILICSTFKGISFKRNLDATIIIKKWIF